MTCSGRKSSDDRADVCIRSRMKDRAASLFPLAMLVLLAALTFWLNGVIQDNNPHGAQRHDADY